MNIDNDDYAIKKDLNNIHDKSYKDLYSNKKVFIDLVQEMLKAPWSKDLKPDNLTLINKSYISSDYEEQESDIVYSANINNGEVIFYVLLEFQSTVDYRMPLRLFFYISEILREYAKNARHKKSDRNLKIPAVIPIVLYNGKNKWDVPTKFRDIVYNGEIFGHNIVDFNYDIFDINHDYAKEELINSKSITSAIFLLDQKVSPVEFLNRIKAIVLYFDNLTVKEKQVLKHWIKNSVEESLAKEAVEILDASKEEVETMVASNAFILTEMQEQAKAKGREEGIEAGREEGIKKQKEADRVAQSNVALKLLMKRFGSIDDEIKERISKLEIEKINYIIENIFDIENISDIKF